MHANELFDVIFRWAHLIAGIMWVGNSMLFNWLDRNLEKAADQDRLSQGKIFMVHSGAFYDVEKKLLEPGAMPATMHWFKWQNFSTWLTGIFLFVIVYYLGSGAAGGLVEPTVHRLDQTVAVVLSISALFTAWVIYDGMWRTLGVTHERLAHALSTLMLFAAVYGFCQAFSGRAAYMQVGVIIGTMMTGNVWMVIVPSQRELINATKAGREQDPALSIRAKQRSIHNNYLTFPLLFIMISNHFGSATSHELNWLVLICVMIGGAGVRYFMNTRYLGAGVERPTLAWLAPAIGAGAFAVAGLVVVTQIDSGATIPRSGPVMFSRVQEIVAMRCQTCHSAQPGDDVFRAPPNNVMFDTPEQLERWAVQIRRRVVEQQNMPLMNKTLMTLEERGELMRWIDDGAQLPKPRPLQ